MQRPEFVRVKSHATGHEVSVPAGHYAANKAAYTRIDRPATDSVGDPLPPKYKTTPSAPNPLDAMTVDELRGYAEEHNIDLGEASKKADIRAVIDEAQV